MDMIKIECFLAVARERNYSRAAEEISLSQSSVSKHILQMEQELGVKLFERNHHTVNLTTAGETLLEDFRIMQERYGIIQDKARQCREATVQSLEIGGVNHLQKVGAFGPIVSFMHAYPNVTIHFHEGDTNRLMRDFITGDLDAALVAHIYPPYSRNGNLSYFPKEKFQIYPLVKDHYYLAVNKKHRLANWKNVAWSDLNNENLIILDNTFSSNKIIRDTLKHYGCTAKIIFESNGVDSILGMVQENYGIALLSRRVFKHLDNITAVSMEHPIHRDTVLVGPKSLDSSPVKCFWDYICSEKTKKGDLSPSP